MNATLRPQIPTALSVHDKRQLRTSEPEDPFALDDEIEQLDRGGDVAGWVREPAAPRIEDGGPAFPFVEPPTACNTSEGMSKREYFASLALQSILAGDGSWCDLDFSPVSGKSIMENNALCAVAQADALLSVLGAPVAPSRELVAQLKHMVRWHDQLKPADIERAKALIAKHEGGAS